MKDRSDDPSHHERTLLPRSYISLPIDKEKTSDYMGYSIRFKARILFMHHKIVHTMTFVTPLVEYWLEREMSTMSDHTMSMSRDSTTDH